MRNPGNTTTLLGKIAKPNNLLKASNPDIKFIPPKGGFLLQKSTQGNIIVLMREAESNQQSQSEALWALQMNKAVLGTYARTELEKKVDIKLEEIRRSRMRYIENEERRMGFASVPLTNLSVWEDRPVPKGFSEDLESVVKVRIIADDNEARPEKIINLILMPRELRGALSYRLLLRRGDFPRLHSKFEDNWRKVSSAYHDTLIAFSGILDSIPTDLRPH